LLSIQSSLHEPSPFRTTHPSNAMQRDGKWYGNW